MSRGSAVILANTVFELDNRVRKQAEALAADGFDVVRLGFVRSTGEAESEDTSAGRIVRIQKAHGPTAAVARGGEPNQVPRGISAAIRRLKYGVAKLGGPLDDVRHYLGRLEENRLLFDRAVALSPDLVVACDLETLGAGSRLKSRSGSRLIYDVHELALEQYAEWSRLRRFLYGRMERRHIGLADIVMTVSPLQAEYLEQRYGILRPLVVFNGPSEVTPHPDPVHNPVRILFQGNFSANRGLVSLVEGMTRLRGRAILTLQGLGVMEPTLREAVRQHDLEGVVVFEGAFRPEEVITRGRQHDVGIVAYPLTTEHLRRTVPNKVMDYLGAGLAIASVAAPGIVDVIDLEECGVTFEGPESMFEVLERLVEQPEKVSAMKRHSGELGAEFLWDGQAGRFIEAATAPRP